MFNKLQQERTRTTKNEYSCNLPCYIKVIAL